MFFLKTWVLSKSFWGQSQNRPSNQRKVKVDKSAEKGQLIIEYVLLLTMVTVLAGILISGMIGQSDDPANQGLIVRKWSQVVNAIAGDVIDN